MGNIEESEVYAKEFYDYIGSEALKLNIIISVLNIVSDNCKLEFLLPVVRKTEGTITKVDP